MKFTTYQKIARNHNLGLNTPIGRYLYNIQYDYMGGFWRVIRCVRGWENGTAVQYDFCGNAIGNTQGNNWEWRERLPKEVIEWIRGE